MNQPPEPVHSPEAAGGVDPTEGSTGGLTDDSAHLSAHGSDGVSGDVDDDIDDDEDLEDEDPEGWEGEESWEGEQGWDGTADPAADLSDQLWRVQEVGTLTAELDQFDELAWRWRTGPAAAEAAPAGEEPASPDLVDRSDPLGDARDGDDDAQPALVDGAEDAHDGGDGRENVEDLPVTLRYKLKYPDVYTWYEEWFRKHYCRSVDGRRRVWSGAWYDNLEALARMESLWRVWESARQDPEGGLSLWFLEHADEHMKVLMSTEGPFESLQNSEQDFSSSTEPLAWRPPARAVGNDDEDDEPEDDEPVDEDEVDRGEASDPVAQRVDHVAAQASGSAVGEPAQDVVPPRRTPASLWSFPPQATRQG